MILFFNLVPFVIFVVKLNIKKIPTLTIYNFAAWSLLLR